MDYIEWLLVIYVVIGLVIKMSDDRDYHSELHIICSALIWPRELYRRVKKWL